MQACEGFGTIGTPMNNGLFAMGCGSLGSQGILPRKTTERFGAGFGMVGRYRIKRIDDAIGSL
eukprot:scaffold90105_cov33-Attheya_sp.AAC.1